MKTWLIYGAYGYTGKLIVDEALRRGHRPVLAGRSERKLRELAGGLGLEHVAFDVTDAQAASKALNGVDVLLNAAGPFEKTSRPLVDLCLAHRVHYLDITGEIAVFEENLARDGEARAAGITLMSGVGFDVVPTDCAARYVAARVPNATRLELAIAIDGGTSAGTLATVLETLPRGIVVRRDGALTKLPSGARRRVISFSNRKRSALPAPWGDVATAFRSTGIPNITVYMAFPWLSAVLMSTLLPLAEWALSFDWLRRTAMRLFGSGSGPSDRALPKTKTSVWARAENDAGQVAQTWLELAGSYPFTASAAVRIVEKVRAGAPAGALTPAMAFGEDFVLEIPGTKRLEAGAPD